MSQAGILDVESANPQIPTSFITDDGTAIPILNELELLASVVPNAGIPFESVGSGNVVTYEIQYADETAASDATKVGLASFDSTAFDVDANGFVTLLGGGVAATNIDVDASTAPGTDPVVPDGAGNIAITGGQVAAGVVGANVLRTNSTAANSLAIEIQRATSGAVSNVNNNGVSHFNSDQFSVDANGFVSLSGGSAAIDSIGVQTGTNPIVPTAAGLVTINGAVVAAGTNPVRSDGTGANTMAIEVQISQAIAATDATKIGLCNFDSSDFSVDANGFVALNGAGAGQTITGDTGGALSPTAGNWNILGQQAGTVAVMDTIGSGSTLNIEDRTWISSLVVDPSATVGLRGTYTTIQSAITAASSGQTIYVRPGSYTENLTLKAGITICAMLGDSFNNNVQINGSITCTYAGIASISGCKLVATAAGGIILSGAAGTQLYLKSCIVYQFSGAGTHYSYASSDAANSCSFYECYFDTDAFGSWFNISAGTVQLIGCVFVNTGGSSVANLMSGGVFTMDNTSYGLANTILPPWTISGGTFTAFGSTINGGITTSATSVLEINNCRCYYSAAMFTLGGTSHNIWATEISTGAASAISVSTAVVLSNCVIASTNTNAITGAGTVTYSGLSFTGSTPSSTINTTTQVPAVKSNDAIKVVTPGAYPYTTTPQDGIILVDTSSARTITPLASPTTGQMHIIKDSVGSAASNNITITPSGKNIDGAASSTINIAYGSVTIVYNGTEWSII